MSDQENKPKFKAVFYQQSWNCGDGCCTESWHDMVIHRGEETFESNDHRSVWSEEDAQVVADNFIQQFFNLEKDEYELLVDY
jgi:hypothetical protein